MTTVSVHQAKSQLSKLLTRVENGEEITVARAGQPVARLIPARPVGARTPGRLRGRFKVTAAFFGPLPDELLRSFEDRKPRRPPIRS